jgi:predicted deacylase
LSRHTARLLAASLAFTLLPAGAAFAQPTAPEPPPAPAPAADGSDRGREAVDTGSLRDPAAPPAQRYATPLSPDAAEARAAVAADCALSFYPFDPADASIAIGVIPYHDIAPRLCRAATSDRVTLEVAGRSVQGRELPLVTITAPETAEQAARNEQLEALMTADPEAAAAQKAAGAYDSYKPALMMNNNIHGNEWEGTDYALDLIDYLSTAPATAPVVQNTAGFTTEQLAAVPTVGALLERFRVVVMPTANPDGRVLGQRQNATLIDMNRDHITQDQPEVRAMRDAIIAAQPLVFQDHHGYVNGSGTSTFYTGYGLIEPTTPPHGEAYEYDLYIRNALPLAEQAEADILRRRAAGDIDLMPLDIGVTIPFRDMAEGWDDWPPIFTPMYSMYHGSVGSTIEFPWSPRGVADRTVRARNVRNNIEFGRATVDTMLAFGVQNRDQLLTDQLDVYRRGAAGAPSPYPTIPNGLVPGWGDEDRYPTEYPRAYVIPVGEGQASEKAAARLAQHLIDNDVRVSTLTRATALNGTTYPVGSYVVDMHQAKRGLAHVMLHEGTDISDRVDSMYDISGWSLSLLWGATVADVSSNAFLGASERVTAARPVGGVEQGSALGYALELTSEDEIRALTRLWNAGVTLQRAPDGTVLVPASARASVVALAAELDVAFTRVTELPAGRTQLPKPRIASALGTTVLGQSSTYLLREALGFDVTTVTPAQIREGTVSLTGFDVLLTAEGQLTWANLQASGQQAMRGYLSGGGAVVTYGRSSALNLVGASGLVPDLTVQGSRTDANGVLAISTTQNPVLPGRQGPGHSFGYPIAWFPQTGSATTVQTLAADPLVSGHWRPGADPNTQAGQPTAAGQALTVAAQIAGGGRLVAFGSEPLFRWHPKGLFDEVVDAMLWAADLPAATTGLGVPYAAPVAPRPAQPTAGERATDDSCPPARIPAQRFSDVPATHTHASSIACMDWWTVAQGFTDGTFRPQADVTRGQMASFIARAVREGGGTLPSAPANRFDDDDTSNHQLAINQLAEVGIVLGRTDRTYEPEAPVSRAQMASFLVRAYKHVSGVDLPLGGPYFSDVAGLTQRDDVNRAAAVGLTAGRVGDRYDPQAPTARGQMATFLARLLDLFVEDGKATPPSR